MSTKTVLSTVTPKVSITKATTSTLTTTPLVTAWTTTTVVLQTTVSATATLNGGTVTITPPAQKRDTTGSSIANPSGFKISHLEAKLVQALLNINTKLLLASMGLTPGVKGSATSTATSTSSSTSSSRILVAPVVTKLAVVRNPSGYKAEAMDSIESSLAAETATLGKRAVPPGLQSISSNTITSLCNCVVTAPSTTVVKTLTAAAATITFTAPASITTKTASALSTVQTTVVSVIQTVTAASPSSGGSSTYYAPAAYCAGTDILGSVVGAPYKPQCGQSYLYLDNNLPSSYSFAVNTTSTYTQCLGLCDSDGACEAFSFLLNQTTNNCYIFDVLGQFDYPATVADPNVNSGVYDPNYQWPSPSSALMVSFRLQSNLNATSSS